MRISIFFFKRAKPGAQQIMIPELANVLKDEKPWQAMGLF